MDCKRHSGMPAANTCNVCGDWLCDECVVEVNGRNFCKSCISKKFDASSGAEESREKSKEASSATKSTHRPISSFFLFVCATMPGCGQMYLGLLKRGLIIMFAFFSTSYLSGNFWDIFWIFMPVIWFASFFDSFNMKNKIINGEPIKDDIDDLKNLVLEYRTAIITVVAVLAGFELIGSMKYLPRYFSRHIYMRGLPWASDGFSKLLSAALVLIAVLLFFKKHKKLSAEKKDDIDKE